jgi:uroporphyrin-III C-methyltransferase / precorrin-2 dehydrogenase / sirohydrochlorin ferrochelatase
MSGESNHMDYLPVFLRLEGEPALVVGGGAVAARKAQWLARAGAQVTIVAPHWSPAVTAGIHHEVYRGLAEAFAPAHLQGVRLAVAASDDPATNEAVSRAARAVQIPVNVVDSPELSTFIFPAIIERSPVLVAVSSAGAAPVLARQVREQIEALLPARLGALARFMGERRREVQQALGAWARRAFWERIARGPTAERILAGDGPGACRDFAAELRTARLTGHSGARPALGEVYLIGAGPGDPDLLTLRALRLLQQADVILYDRLVPEAILERARRDAERISVGKVVGDAGGQERINQLMLELAAQGKRVARLKGGDPFVFGRGGEELEVLAAHDIPYTVVPGITAALAAGAVSGIPLTHRRLAHSVTLVTGHAAEGHDDRLDWRALAAPDHTAVFYMGIAQLPHIVARLRGAGAAATHPAAIVERAALPGERVLRTTLEELPALAAREQIRAPALLIVGDVAAFDPASTATVRSRSAPAPAVAVA